MKCGRSIWADSGQLMGQSNLSKPSVAAKDSAETAPSTCIRTKAYILSLLQLLAKSLSRVTMSIHWGLPDGDAELPTS